MVGVLNDWIAIAMDYWIALSLWIIGSLSLWIIGSLSLWIIGSLSLPLSLWSIELLVALLHETNSLIINFHYQITKGRIEIIILNPEIIILMIEKGVVSMRYCPLKRESDRSSYFYPEFFCFIGFATI